MDAKFQAELNRVLHGNYDVTGFSSYATLAVDAGTGASRRMGTELHEWVHSELSDMTTYGWFQQFFAMISRNADHELRGRARRVFDGSMAATAVTQEGLASLREFAWVAAHEGEDEIEAFLGGIPEYYRTGLDRALKFFGSPRLGDPENGPYLGYSPPVFHVAVIMLGLVIMNSPILVHYADPEIFLNSNDLRWISQEGPDRRFESLVNYRDPIAEMLLAVLQLATRKGKEIVNTEVLLSVYDFGLEYMRENIPGFPIVTRKESRTQTQAFTDNWIPFLNQRSGGSQFIGQRGTIDVSRDRALDLRYERRNQGPHEADVGRSTELVFPSFVSAHQRENIADIFRLIMFSTIPPGLPEEFLFDCDVGLLSVPMWEGSVSESSPFVKFRPIFYCETRMRDLVQRSEDLARTGCVWYSNFSLVRSIRRLGIGVQGLIIEKCDSPALLLAVADQPECSRPSFATFRFGDERVLAVISDDTFSFSLASEFQIDAFIERAASHNMRGRDGDSLHIGSRDVAPELVARAALWGFVGR